MSAEFEDIVEAASQAKTVTNPWKNISQAKYRPQLVTAILIPLFQQFTGALPPAMQCLN